MDELPPDLEDLLGEARRDVGESDRLARVAARLGPALDTPAPPRWSWKIKALGGSLALGALLAALPLARAPSPPLPAALSAAPAAPPPTVSSAAIPTDPASAPAAIPTAAASAGPGASAPPGPQALTSAPARGGAGDVVEEHALLAEARRALGSSPAQALALVQQHQRRFPAGMLATEREFLRISALSRLGRTGEARAAADRFLAAHRGSPYAAEVGRIAGR